MVKKEKITALSIIKKQNISALTAYDYPIAKLLDESGIDIILVGDSLGNVMLGYRNTIPVTMTEMIIHTQAVSRAVNRALVVADLPFGSYQKGTKEALSNAIDLVKAGAEAVKLEGAEYLDEVKSMIRAGIPVMGHLGFTPQSVNKLGHKLQDVSVRDAKKLEAAGCFAVVLEMVPPDTAQKITKALKIPTIGIGSGPHCDGQILVTYDMIGLYPNPPKFVRKYADLSSDITKAVKNFIADVRAA
ncbi:MAG: 3-methyl-2-oxobutanoate hydroxymethyltransferase [Candidatus Margulisiibacteriota bacterium]